MDVNLVNDMNVLQKMKSDFEYKIQELTKNYQESVKPFESAIAGLDIAIKCKNIEPSKSFDEFKDIELSQNWTLKVVRCLDSGEGVYIREIVKFYSDKNINTNNNCINSHLEKLMNKKQVFHINKETNPQRFKRFSTISNLNVN